MSSQFLVCVLPNGKVSVTRILSDEELANIEEGSDARQEHLLEEGLYSDNDTSDDDFAAADADDIDDTTQKMLLAANSAATDDIDETTLQMLAEQFKIMEQIEGSRY